MKLDIGGTLHPLMCPRGNPADDFDRNLASQLSEYKCVDKYHMNDITIQADIFEIPVPDNSVEAVYSSHTIEHVEQHRVPALLKEWHRILQPNGPIWISSPSMNHMIDNYLEADEDSTEHDYHHSIIFANHLNEGDHHIAAFNIENMTKYMMDAGFILDEIKHFPCHGQMEVRVRAHK